MLVQVHIQKEKKLRWRVYNRPLLVEQVGNKGEKFSLNKNNQEDLNDLLLEPIAAEDEYEQQGDGEDEENYEDDEGGEEGDKNEEEGGEKENENGEIDEEKNDDENKIFKMIEKNYFYNFKNNLIINIFKK